jgi:ribosomal protein S12 methylthiotransferase accessory factor
MGKDSEFMMYEMKFVRNSTGIGYFSCVPANDMGVDEIIEYLRDHPNDQFMHNYLLFRLVEFDEDELDTLIKAKKDDYLLLAAVYETSILYDGFHAIRKKIEQGDVAQLARHTPLMFIRWALDKNCTSRCYWMDLFSENVYNHTPLPYPEDVEFPIPFDFKGINEDEKKLIHIRDVSSQSDGKSFNVGISLRTTTAKATVEKILNRLTAVNLLTETEKRTVRSLSPYAFERSWNLDLQVSTGRNRWRLTGPQTSYGKGVEEDGARASYLMEMVERYSSFASFSNNEVIGYNKRFNLVKSSYTQLKVKGFDALDPNIMNLEVPYEDQELYWIVGEEREEHGSREIYLPAQFVFLFCNLDEISLASGISSNGLAAGNTLDGAKLHALIEYIERDSERVALYSKERCFLLEAEDPAVNRTLNACKKKGLNIQFLDMTSDLGIPCYKAFVQTVRGAIFKGCGADLNGKIAAASALTELAYPTFVKSAPPPAGLKTVKYEQLPNYSSGDVRQDLRMLERFLLLNGFKPIYVNLTRKDLDIPVVRAIIPGLELMAVLDRFSNFSKRQFRNYLNLS